MGLAAIAWTILVVVILIILVTVVLGYAQCLKWTGMTGRTDDFQRRTLWDWLQLLIVPAVLALGGLWFTAQQDRRQQEMDERRERIVHRVEEKWYQLLSEQTHAQSLTVPEKHRRRGCQVVRG